jgi:hypothetical protein
VGVAGAADGVAGAADGVAGAPDGDDDAGLGGGGPMRSIQSSSTPIASADASRSAKVSTAIHGADPGNWTAMR